MPDISWNQNSDWKDKRSSTGIKIENDKIKQGYSQEKPPLTDGLVGYWPLHDDSAQDYSGNGNHGTMNGGPTTGVAGKGGLEAMSFDGQDDSIKTSLSLSHEKQTISFWFRKESGQADILSQWTPDAQGPIVGINPRGNKYPGTDGSVGIVVRDGSGTGNVLKFETKESSYSDGDWHHAVITYTPSNTNLSEYVEIFVDGEKKDTNMPMSQGEVSAWDNETLHFLYNENDNFYTSGTVCDVRIYNRILSQSEIQTLYEWGSADLASPPTDGVARYPLDGDATDSFGSNDGTENGSLTYSSDAIRGQSADFDGTDDYIDTPVAADYGTGGFSLSMWVSDASQGSSSPDGDRTYASTYDGNTGFIAQYDGGAGSLRFWVGGDPNLYAPSLPVGFLTHVAFVATTDEARIYTNGRLAASAPRSGDVSSSDNLTLGARTGGSRQADGRMDDVRIYDYALEPWEVFELYRWGTRGKDLRKDLVRQ